MRSRFVLAALAIGLTVQGLVPTASAQPPSTAVSSGAGGSTTDLRARAAALTDQIEALGAQIGDLEEEALGVDEDLARIDAEMTATRSRLEAAKKQRAQREEEARRYAVNAFVGGAESGFSTDAKTMTESASRRQLATVLHGDRQELVAALQASGEVLADAEAQLAADEAERTARRDQLDATRNKMEESQAELNATLDQVKGRIAQLVAEEQARREAEAAKKAREAAARAAQQRASTPGRTSGGTAGRTTTGSTSDPTTTSRSPGTAGGGGVAPTTTTVTRPTVTTVVTTLPPTPPPVAPPAPSGGTAAGRTAVAAALTQLGVRYVWAGSSPSGFDCSGLVMWAYAKAGVSLPHSSRSLRAMTRRISESELVPGDLVFGGSPVHHVGIYIGNGKMVHAPRTGDVVKVSGIYSSSKPVSFGRL